MFIQSAQSITEVAKKEEQSKIVLYRGRKIEQALSLQNFFYQNVNPRLSGLDRYALAFNKLFETNIFHQTISVMLPQGIKDMLSRLDPLFLGEEDDEVSVELEESYRCFQEIFMLLNEQKKRVLSLEGVSSAEELVKKQEKLSQIRQEVEQVYLNSFHVSKRKKIDRGLIWAFKQNIDKRERKIIEDYWNLIVAQPRIHKNKIKQLNSDLIHLFLKSITSVLDINQIKNHSNFNEFYQKIKEKLIFKCIESLKKKRFDYQSVFNQVLIDYVLLMSQYKLELILREKMREKLNFRLQEIENVVEEGMLFFRKQNQNKLNLYQTEQIKKCQSYIALLDKLVEEIKEQQTNEPLSPCKCREFVQRILYAKIEVTSQIEEKEKKNVEVLKLSLKTILEEMASEGMPSKFLKHSLIQCLEDIEGDLSQIKKCQSKTKKDFKELALKTVKEHFGETPSEIKAYFPAQTAFEKLIFEFRKIENPGLSASQELLSHEVYFSLDIQWETCQTQGNLYQYFFRQLKAIDEQKLKLFKLKIVE